MVCDLVLSVAVLGCLSICGGLRELVVLYSNHSRCGLFYVFNIIVISKHCGACMCVWLLLLFYSHVAEV
jgi:hypothetical protein